MKNIKKLLRFFIKNDIFINEIVNFVIKINYSNDKKGKS